jgi:hypothetical protein
MAFKTGTGSDIAIGTTLATPSGTQTEYEADTYTLIGDIETIGAFGDERSNVPFASLGDGRRQKARGIADAGDQTITYAHKTGDTGQAALLAAYAATSQATDEFNFRVRFNDAVTVNKTTRYYRARVLSQRVREVTNDGVIIVEAILAINTAVLEVAAS